MYANEPGAFKAHAYSHMRMYIFAWDLVCRCRHSNCVVSTLRMHIPVKTSPTFCPIMMCDDDSKYYAFYHFCWTLMFCSVKHLIAHSLLNINGLFRKHQKYCSFYTLRSIAVLFCPVRPSWGEWRTISVLFFQCQENSNLSGYFPKIIIYYIIYQ